MDNPGGKNESFLFIPARKEDERAQSEQKDSTGRSRLGSLRYSRMAPGICSTAQITFPQASTIRIANHVTNNLY